MKIPNIVKEKIMLYYQCKHCSAMFTESHANCPCCNSCCFNMVNVTVENVQVDFNLPTRGNFIMGLSSIMEIIYFGDQSHKHRGWAFNALEKLSPSLAKIAGDDSVLAFKLVEAKLGE